MPRRPLFPPLELPAAASHGEEESFPIAQSRSLRDGAGGGRHKRNQRAAETLLGEARSFIFVRLLVFTIVIFRIIWRGVRAGLRLSAPFKLLVFPAARVTDRRVFTGPHDSPFDCIDDVYVCVCVCIGFIFLPFRSKSIIVREAPIGIPVRPCAFYLSFFVLRGARDAERGRETRFFNRDGISRACRAAGIIDFYCKLRARPRARLSRRSELAATREKNAAIARTFSR